MSRERRAQAGLGSRYGPEQSPEVMIRKTDVMWKS